jgi:hypothetical protein
MSDEETFSSEVTLMSLPIEIIFLIINKLDINSYGALSSTCNYFYNILCDEEQLKFIFSIREPKDLRKFLQIGCSFVSFYRLLFKEKLKISHFEVSNYYPFRVVANKGYYGVMKFLFDRGLNYEAIESEQCSILINAIKRNSIEMFKFLLYYGLCEKHISMNNLLVYRKAIKFQRTEIIIFLFEKLNLSVDYFYSFDNLLLRRTLEFDNEKIIKFIIKDYHEVFNYKVLIKLLKNYDATKIRKLL